MDKAIDSIITISLTVQSFFVTDILKKKKTLGLQNVMISSYVLVLGSRSTQLTFKTT